MMMQQQKENVGAKEEYKNLDFLSFGEKSEKDDDAAAGIKCCLAICVCLLATTMCVREYIGFDGLHRVIFQG